MSAPRRCRAAANPHGMRPATLAKHETMASTCWQAYRSCGTIRYFSFGSMSVLRTCVRKQTKDLCYRDVEPLWFLSFGLTHDDAVCPRESRIVDQRLQFLSSYQKEEMSVSELCREFGVSRPSGYRWIIATKRVGPKGC